MPSNPPVWSLASKNRAARATLGLAAVALLLSELLSPHLPWGEKYGTLVRESVRAILGMIRDPASDGWLFLPVPLTVLALVLMVAIAPWCVRFLAQAKAILWTARIFAIGSAIFWTFLFVTWDSYLLDPSSPLLVVAMLLEVVGLFLIRPSKSNQRSASEM